MAQVQLTTDVKNFKSESFASATILTQRKGTTTQPASAAGSKIIGGSLNYLKFKFFNDTNNAITIYIFGWSFNSDYMMWEPQLLFSCSTTLTSSFTHPIYGAAYEAASYTKVTGDAKIFNGAAGTGNGGFILVDTLGSQFIEVQGIASGGNIYFQHSGL